ESIWLGIFLTPAAMAKCTGIIARGIHQHQQRVSFCRNRRLKTRSMSSEDKTMPHISLPEGLPGITSGFAFRPETAKPMRELAHVLLHGPSTLTPGERELIATYVSSQNDCYFCQASHGAAAAAHLGKNSDLVEEVKRDFLEAGVSEKLKALLVIAGEVQQGG